jgi:outer membrane protein
LQRKCFTAFTDAKGAFKVIRICCTVEARQGAVDYAKERYNVGLMNSFDYNQAQTFTY